MARMRYARQAYELIRKEDPGTGVTLNFIRTLIKSGKVRTVKVGARTLVDVDDIIDYMVNPARGEVEMKGKIQRIPEQTINLRRLINGLDKK